MNIDKNELDITRGQLMLSFMKEDEREKALQYLESFLNPYQIADVNSIAESSVRDRILMDIAIRDIDAKKG